MSARNQSNAKPINDVDVDHDIQNGLHTAIAALP